MKTLLPTLALAALSTANPISLSERQNSGSGSGPYAPAHYYTNNAHPRHTFYAPRNTPSNTKLPVLVWGNGACSADGTQVAPFLTQIASHGILVIASGTPGGGGSTTAQMMTDSINFITRNAGSGAFSNVDASRIVAAGWSCGGVEAYAQIWDSRVQSVGIWNSGLLTNHSAAGQFNKPVFFFVGGQSDAAYPNSERDYNNMRAGVPKWKGNLNVGHGGTYGDYNGGKFGTIGAYWAQWVLRGNETAGQYLTGEGARRDGWQVVSRDLDRFRVNPI